MAYTVIIAEKPSVAASIAKVVGARTAHRDKANGYLEGNGYRVTWAFGHLVGLNSPEDMGFKGETLPIMPEEWKTHVITYAKGDMTQTVARQMKTLDGLFSGADRIIVATDAGREGELIFRYIYEHLGCRTPFDRLWISSLTDEAIRKGMAALRPGKEMDALSDAAHARSEADWLVGFNASRAIRIASGYKGNLSLGRVQTPVLVMVCKRYLDNKNFTPTPFWQLAATVRRQGDTVEVPTLSVHRYQSEQAAAEALAAVKGSMRFLVTKIETKDVTSKTPLLHDLTSLQRTANNKYGMTADETLKVAQGLYEKKFLSYPRTGSRYIPEDVYKTLPALIAKIEGYGRDSFRDAAKDLRGRKLCRRSVDDTKVTDHHALLPTDVLPTGLSEAERNIWELVCGRMLEAFGEDSVARRTTVDLECASVPFRTSGSVPIKPGWKAVFGFAEEQQKKKGSKDDDPEGTDETPDAGVLPPFKEKEHVDGTKAESLRKTDKPLPVYTDSSLLGEMETCGKKIDDEELRESLKDVGLGTPATRAATIETLISRGYVVRSGKKLTPTELGLAIAETVKGRKIADVATTGEWERELARIERGETTKAAFDTKIRTYAQQIIDDLLANCKSLDGVSSTKEPTRSCPCCGKPMKNLKFNILCDNADGASGCGLKIPREAAGKKLLQSAVEALCQGKDTALIKGFTSKSGKRFDAKLHLDKEARKITFAFDDKPAGPQAEGRTCPCCGQTMTDDRWKLSCACGLTVWKTCAQVPLTLNEIDLLLAGKTVPKTGFVSKAGKKFDAGLRLDKDAKKVEFVFEDRKKTKK